MKKEKIFKVEGYKRSAGSFKLDLRYACKENPFYFTSVNMFTKNVEDVVEVWFEDWRLMTFEGKEVYKMLEILGEG